MDKQIHDFFLYMNLYLKQNHWFTSLLIEFIQLYLRTNKWFHIIYEMTYCTKSLIYTELLTIIQIHRVHPPTPNERIHSILNKFIDVLYSAIPCIICLLFLLLIFVGQETQLIIFPNIWPKNRKNHLIKFFFNFLHFPFNHSNKVSCSWMFTN